MKLLPIITIAMVGIIAITSCEKKYFKPPVVDPNTPVSFSTDIQPIFTANCLGSGCHNGGQKPNLVADKAYSSLLDEAYVDTLNPSNSVLMVKLNSNMPQTGKLPPATIAKVLTWIKQGAKQN